MQKLKIERKGLTMSVQINNTGKTTLTPEQVNQLLAQAAAAQSPDYLKIFLITMILGGITEYVCSYIQEKVFGTISWDYSYLIFNIKSN